MDEIKRCSKCVCDNSIPGISFDDSGVCSLCKNYELIESEFPQNDSSQEKLFNLFNNIKKLNVNNKYDCVIGISGGTDSIYMLYLIKKFGLNPLAIHVDDGWNTKVAQNNIINAVEILNVDLKTIKIDENEMVDLTLAFLKSSVPDVEVPPDLAITGSLYREAQKAGVKHILVGSSFKTEGKMPPGWSYGDGKYLRSVHKKFGHTPLRSYPNVLMFDYFYFNVIKKIRTIRPLYYVPYVKKDIKILLSNELKWVDYGEGHHESIYTRFVQGYLLPTKFGIDKRIIHYSAQVRSGQLTRDEALRKLSQSAYDEKLLQGDIDFLCTKLKITQDEFNKIMSEEPRDRSEFKSYYHTVLRFRFLINMAYKMHLFPTKIYGKYDR